MAFLDVECEGVVGKAPNSQPRVDLAHGLQQERRLRVAHSHRGHVLAQLALEERLGLGPGRGDHVAPDHGRRGTGGAAEDYELRLGSGSFIPGFEEQLVGANVGDEKTVSVTFPEDYGAEHLAGKEASFKVNVKGMKALGPAEINDALAEKMGAENLDDLRSKVRETMESQYKDAARNKVKRALFDKLEELHDFPLPEVLVEQEYNGIWSEIERQLEGDNADEVREGKTDEELKEEYRKVAARRVRLGLLLSEVGRQNNIEVSQEDLVRAVAQQASQYPGQEEMVQKFYMENPQMLGQLQAPLLEDKVVDYILELAKVDMRKVPPAEIMADDDDGGDAGETADAKGGAKDSETENA